MLVYVTTDFKDLLFDCPRYRGAILEVTDERGEEIIKAGYGKPALIINAIPEAESEVEPEKPEGVEDGGKNTGKAKKN